MKNRTAGIITATLLALSALTVVLSVAGVNAERSEDARCWVCNAGISRYYGGGWVYWR